MLTIDEHTDLGALRRALEVDRAAIERRAELINGEENRRAYEPSRLAFEAMKQAKEQRRADHAALVIECRTAKDELARHNAKLAKLQQPVVEAQGELSRAQWALGAHAPLNPNEFPLPEELAAWQTEHGKLAGVVSAAQGRLTTASAAYQDAVGERDKAADALRELAGREWALRTELHA